MVHRVYRWLFPTLALAVFSSVASAQTLYVGDLSYDEPTPGSVDQFDITNFVGNGLAVNSELGPVSATTFDIDVTSLTVDLESGSPIVIPGSDFTSVDGAGDLDCNASACNLYGDEITSATLVGTFSETGLTGLDPGYTGIDDAFTTVITPSCGTYLEAGCDTALITATETAGGPVGASEPGSWALLGVGTLGLFLLARKRLHHTSAKRVAVA